MEPFCVYRGLSFYYRKPKSVAPSFMLFSLDTVEGKGNKCYVVGTYEDMWAHCAGMCTETYAASLPCRLREREWIGRGRAWYEVLLPDRPTKLFLDLEYDVSTNPTLDGELVLAATLRGVGAMLSRDYPCVDATAQVWTSCTPKKVSYHVLYPGVVFRTDMDVYAYVRRVLIPHVVRKSPETLVRTSGGKTICFIDDLKKATCNFRMPYGMKKKQGARALVPHAGAVIEAVGSAAWCVQVGQSSVQYVPEIPGVLLRVLDDDAVSPKSRVVKRPRGTRMDECVTLLERIRVWLESTSHPETTRRRRVPSLVPYGGEGSWLGTSTGDHYCGIAGRAHRNNFIFYKVDVVARTVTQGCHNARCKKKKRLVMDIPKELFGAAATGGAIRKFLSL